MSTEPTSSRISQLRKSARKGSSVLRDISGMLRLTFASSPPLLFKSGLQPKDAALMIALSVSALLCVGLLTVPAFLFPTPQHNAYFQFSRILEEDTSRWFVLSLASVCTLIAMVLPAAHRPMVSAKN